MKHIKEYTPSDSSEDQMVIITMMIIAMLMIINALASPFEANYAQLPASEHCVQEVATAVKYGPLNYLSFGCTVEILQPTYFTFKTVSKAFVFFLAICVYIQTLTEWIVTSNKENFAKAKRKAFFRFGFFFAVGILLPHL